jgi:hypothetical protein
MVQRGTLRSCISALHSVSPSNIRLQTYWHPSFAAESWEGQALPILNSYEVTTDSIECYCILYVVTTTLKMFSLLK